MEWADDGVLYSEGIMDINSVEEYLAEEPGVPGVEAGRCAGGESIPSPTCALIT